MFEVTMNLYWDFPYRVWIELIFDKKFKDEYEFWRVVHVQRVD